MQTAAAELGLAAQAPEGEEGATLDRAGLAEFLGVAGQRIDKWVADGMPAVQAGREERPTATRPDACLGWAVRTAKDSVIEKFLHGSGRSSQSDLSHERALLARVQTAEAERKRAIAMGQLVHVDEVASGWATVFATVKTRLLAIPVTVLGTFPNQPELADTVEQLVYDALDELSDEGSADQDPVHLVNGTPRLAEAAAPPTK